MKLGKKGFMKVCETIESLARPLDIGVYESYFHNASEKNILSALLSYQNTDGGYGHGLEGDFLMPLSSPMATSIAFQYLISIKSQTNATLSAIQAAIRYFENTFVPERNGWFAVRKEVNEYPHAPWWAYDDPIKKCPIDASWGNPSAEIIGYLYKFKEYASILDVSGLMSFASAYLNSLKRYESFHEMFCYKRLYDIVSYEYRAAIKDTLSKAITSVVCTDVGKWDMYNAKPLDFFHTPQKEYFGIDIRSIHDNLDYLIKRLEAYNGIFPNWEWGMYDDEWKNAKMRWTGLLSLKALKTLDAFGRIDY